ncbi:polycystin-2-like protein 2 isoform X7 [Canis lupus baileyi]|uniref:polycystic kidney disease 2-like 2 protein isoform X6 n=1 Tax=Canis lupus familiaris TaxID=9615 RepID=UPI000BAA0B83|nr:polycystic kidney disease 2-like 2 protein isoform X6 [Canis lupus familiaris]XP_025288502.1 polycystic kidney disease 2-like 2 protein isoform X6 [Canis lupus dingo]XP_038408198.1 polycystic kidney disease 2-like 2 protein isoform X6 [Canis lupus familiaris]XP_038537554.1 polycystic kidney disease 2-like 2 protein isoform X6 [Canis lupus familiaris]|eukprot:XP_022281050.1 polycystic kidney disease 2-like 2 protein isoform X6 [Canis lupus familiaris]
MAEASRWHRGGTPKPKLHYRKEVEIRTTLQELALYFIFLINLCILTFGMVNPHMYYLNKVMSSLFLDTSVPGDERTNFKSIRSITDFWKFMEGPLLEGLYWDSWYTNKTLYDLKNSSRIYYENILLGVPRVRQLKVRNNTCKVYSSFQSLMNECYDKYTSKSEDMDEFGLKQETEYRKFLEYISVRLSRLSIILFIPNRWKYAAPTSSSPWHWGFVGVYQNGGFIFTLSKSKSETKNKFVDLKLNSWITRGTRVIFIDFSLYNANVNLFCIIRLAAEFPATGGIITSWQFYSVKLLRYVSYYDYIIASCEITFCIFLIVFTTQEAQKIREFKSAYFKSVWNWLELLLLVNMFLAIINDTYSEVKADYSIGRRPDFELGKMIKKSYNNALEKLRLKKPEQDEDISMKGDLAEQARREGFDENEIQSAEQMKKWKDRLEKKYYSTEIQDDYQPVTQQEFRESCVTSELENFANIRPVRKCHFGNQTEMCSTVGLEISVDFGFLRKHRT